ncbi:MAG TPA: permease, partial [Desulfobacterales bacterium]|nr:permease [Desulfobacterales bacterium]
MDSFFSIFLIIADFITYRLLGLEEGLKLTESVHFFVYDVLKIIVLLIIIIYVIGLARSTLDMERVRAYIQGKNRFVGYLLASFYGAITPFCSCSSIPLFLGFTAARIPVGITMAFLITSPIINEIAIVLLGSILGIKFTLAYLAVGFIAGIIGGFFFDAIKAERFLTPLGQQSKRTIPLATMGGASPQPPPGLQMAGGRSCSSDKPKSITENSWAARHQFAKAETAQIVKQIWKWV